MPEETPLLDRNAARKQAAEQVEKAVAAEAALKTTAAQAQRHKGRTFFVSAAAEPYCFELQVRGERYTGYWDDQRKHVCWDMPDDHAALVRWLDQGD